MQITKVGHIQNLKFSNNHVKKKAKQILTFYLQIIIILTYNLYKIIEIFNFF